MLALCPFGVIPGGTSSRRFDGTALSVVYFLFSGLLRPGEAVGILPERGCIRRSVEWSGLCEAFLAVRQVAFLELPQIVHNFPGPFDLCDVQIIDILV